MRFLLLSICFLAINAAHSQSPAELTTGDTHLQAINAQWSKWDPNATALINFDSDRERIAFHLEQVILQLKEHPSADPLVQAKRDQLIDVLGAYAAEGRFPINTRHQERRPYFIDDYGTACAVGHLMIESGHEALALRIKNEHNYDYIADIHTPGVSEWAAAFGFTLEELALIQPTYSPDNVIFPAAGGVNGNVSDMLTRAFWDRLYLVGDFTEIGGTTSCPTGVAYLENGILHCITDAPDGRTEDLSYGFDQDLIFAGQYSVDGGTAHLALLSEDQWDYLAIPNRETAKATSVLHRTSPTYRYLVSLDLDQPSGEHEIWNYDEELDEWTLLVTTQGPISTVSPYPYTIFAGDFSSYTDHTAGNAVTNTNNAVSVNLTLFDGPSTTPFESEHLPAHIMAIHAEGNVLYLGGVGDGVSEAPLLSSMQNEVAQPLIGWGIPEAGYGIHDLHSYSSSSLVIAGNLSTGDFGTFGQNVGIYNVVSGYLSSGGVLDSTATRIAEYNGQIYLGGDFEMNLGTSVPHFAVVDASTFVDEQEAPSISVSAYPNPCRDRVTISWEDDTRNLTDLQILDQAGRVIQLDYQVSGAGLQLSIADLAQGTYSYRLITDAGLGTGVFVKD